MARIPNIPYPDLVVFDLDYTLWPFWVDTHVSPPFTLNRYRKILDRKGREVNCYPDVPNILQHLCQLGVHIGVASRTGCVYEANSLLKLFDWDKLFVQCEIFPGSKTEHFRRFQLKSGLPFTRMLFFDDEERNIRDVSALGVTCMHVPDGMSLDVLKCGLDLFAQRWMSCNVVTYQGY